MGQETRSDAELMNAAQSGDASAYAILLYRYGGMVRAAVEDAGHATDAVVDVFLDAMRELGQRDPATPVQPWLLELTEQRLREPVTAPTPPPLMETGERDLIWSELHARWPDGRRARHVPGWLGWCALVVALVGTGVLVPYLVLSNPFEEDRDQPPPEIVAVPWDGEEDGEEDEGDEVTREPAPELFDEHELGQLPEIHIDGAMAADPDGASEPTSDTGSATDADAATDQPDQVGEGAGAADASSESAPGGDDAADGTADSQDGTTEPVGDDGQSSSGEEPTDDPPQPQDDEGATDGDTAGDDAGADDDRDATANDEDTADSDLEPGTSTNDPATEA